MKRELLHMLRLQETEAFTAFSTNVIGMFCEWCICCRVYTNATFCFMWWMYCMYVLLDCLALFVFAAHHFPEDHWCTIVTSFWANCIFAPHSQQVLLLPGPVTDEVSLRPGYACNSEHCSAHKSSEVRLLTDTVTTVSGATAMLPKWRVSFSQTVNYPLT